MSADDINTFKAILAKNNCRVTEARLQTFRMLLSPEPQTIREVIDRSEGIVDRVSVYRNIELFEKLGIVNRISIGWKYKLELSEKFLSHHHHMTCINCETTIDIEDEKHIDDFIHAVAAQKGFVPRRHVFEIDGYCKSCAESRKAN